jgi:DMSO/TMAO reductase YedYZ molybdopterin-dependent catalytic subunit
VTFTLHGLVGLSWAELSEVLACQGNQAYLNSEAGAWICVAGHSGIPLAHWDGLLQLYPEAATVG